MDAIKNLLERKVVVAVLAAVVGLTLGILYAWVLNPVEWVNAEPLQLRQDLRVDYLRMVIDSYSVNLDSELAKDRYEALGDTRGDDLAMVGESPGEISPSAIQKFRALVEIESPVGGTPSTSEETDRPSASSVTKYLLPVCGATFALGVLLAGALVLRRRMEGRTVRPRPEPSIPAPDVVQDVENVENIETRLAEQPLATFRSTFTIRDETYDDSFSIESAAGDFLGECGVGVGDVVGVGEPKKVSAFEIWLFDKNDIQTVTKVLMSRYAFNDEATRTRLAAKGDPVQAIGGGVINLETESLSVEARVVDMNYGQGPLPPDSFFDRLTIELTAWSRRTSP
jgi:hypothetical protein